MRAKDVVLGLVIVLVWGFNFVVIVWGLETMPPLLMGSLRFLLIAVIGSLFVARPQIPLKWLFAYGISLGFGQFAFLFSAMANGMPAGLASLVLQSQALFTLLLGGLLLAEAIKTYQLVAIMIAGGGLALIGWSGNGEAMTAVGFGLTLAGAACWALGNIVNRSISQQGYKASVGLVVWSAWIPPVPFFICSYLVEGPVAIVESVQQISWLAVGALLYLAFVASILGYSLWSHLISRYPAGQIAPLTLGVPAVGLTSAALCLGETVSLVQWAGIALVVFGLVINMRGEQWLEKFWSWKRVNHSL
ncbi:EamA family transporter [Spartinivicinus poritis]|uniref:EamA family transporter n=1 Tax=Spartinivicinus poritis TaxID=2994640 RepID=A0ABT5U3G8_9GAMM|nr:EamA family transporter [Spartinivicinus sp. A2-2]MDE1460901.1 EamA family transporter [Spartinivicinus sp. A2-2]